MPARKTASKKTRTAKAAKPAPAVVPSVDFDTWSALVSQVIEKQMEFSDGEDPEGQEATQAAITKQLWMTGMNPIQAAKHILDELGY